MSYSKVRLTRACRGMYKLVGTRRIQYYVTVVAITGIYTLNFLTSYQTESFLLHSFIDLHACNIIYIYTYTAETSMKRVPSIIITFYYLSMCPAAPALAIFTIYYTHHVFSCGVCRTCIGVYTQTYLALYILYIYMYSCIIQSLQLG